MKYLIMGLMIALYIPLGIAQEVTPEATPEVIELNLVPFTLPAAPYSGVVPAEWSDIQAGIAIRPEANQVSTTYIVHVAIPQTPLDQALAPLLMPLGIDTLPDADGTFTSNEFTWTMYSLSYESSQTEGDLMVDIATAETDEGSFVIALQSTPEEQAILTELVFFPAMRLFGTPREELNTLLNIPELEIIQIEVYGIDSAVPTGWHMRNAGVYGRGSDPLIDSTTLLIQTSTDLDEIDFANLFLERLNIEESLPNNPEIYSSDILTWSIYAVPIASIEAPIQLNIATAHDEQFTYLVVLLVDETESDLLLETVLKPTLLATQPTSED